MPDEQDELISTEGATDFENVHAETAMKEMRSNKYPQDGATYATTGETAAQKGGAPLQPITMPPTPTTATTVTSFDQTQQQGAQTPQSPIVTPPVINSNGTVQRHSAIGGGGIAAAGHTQCFRHFIVTVFTQRHKHLGFHRHTTHHGPGGKGGSFKLDVI